jgi:hypothetical protein
METRDHVQSLETKARATARLAWAIANDNWLSDTSNSVASFNARGWKRYEGHAKAATSATTTTDEAIALMPLDTALLREIGQATIDGRLDGALRLPLTVASRLQVGSVTATTVDESGTKPVARLTFTVGDAPVEKTIGEIIISREAAQALGAETQAAIRELLVDAVARETDRRFVAAAVAAGTSTALSVATLLSSISSGAATRPHLVGGVDQLLALAPGVLRDLREMGVAIVPSAAAAGQLIAIDASGVLIQDGGIDVQVGRHANVLLDDGVGEAGTTTISLFQSNMVSIRCERFVRFTIRPEAVAYHSVGSPE